MIIVVVSCLKFCIDHCLEEASGLFEWINEQTNKQNNCMYVGLHVIYYLTVWSTCKVANVFNYMNESFSPVDGWSEFMVLLKWLILSELFNRGLSGTFTCLAFPF